MSGPSGSEGPARPTRTAPLLGCIADDLTGATDLADTLVRAGLRTRLLVGLPTGDDALLDSGGHAGDEGVPGEPADAPPDAPGAIVVALRIRTAPVASAVAEADRALDLLLAAGATSTYWKVCSTFDSTDRGNIGPVADHLAARLGCPVTLVCPAFPTNGRTVYLGHLFVGGALLAESPMRQHPLTPMTDSHLVRVLGRQSVHPVDLVPLPVVAAGADAVGRRLAELTPTGGTAHVIADAVTDGHLDVLGVAATRCGLALCVGGSGLAGGLARAMVAASTSLGLPATAPAAATATESVRVRGPAVVLAGSCSEATRGQVARFRGHRLIVDPRRLAASAAAAAGAGAAGADHLDELRAALLAEVRAGRPVLLASTTTPEEVAAVQRDLGQEASARAVEDAFAVLARAAVEGGARRLIVAGGETSGAVVDALGLTALRIGPTISPGVPWTVGRAGPGGPGPGGHLPAGHAPGGELALALKSGNFGGPDFFAEAEAVLDG